MLQCAQRWARSGTSGGRLCFAIPTSSTRPARPLASRVHRRAYGGSVAHHRQTIFSGIQPTGVPHLGNYLGALKEWVRLQEESEPGTKLIYSLVDLHAITVRQEPEQLRKWKKESLATLLAIGLDPARSIIFNQSDVVAHTELMWILSCQASTGYLSRMTQWKDKTANSKDKDNAERLKLGLFSYPVLQAADVLVHDATHVPVGEDQAQHLEFARELAIGFNHVFGKDTLVPPSTLISPAKRVMSLVEAKAKMSKSAPNPKSRILLTDSEDDIRAKVKLAVTDSYGGVEYDPERRAGLSNLINIILYTSDAVYETRDDVVKDLQGASWKVIKEKVVQCVEQAVRPIRERYAEVIEDDRMLDRVASEGAEKARKSADVSIKRVKQAVGLI